MGFEYYKNDDTFVQNDVANDKAGRFYNVKRGLTTVRILPAYSARGRWYEEISEHGFQVNGKYQTFTCPKMEGRACVICEHGLKLRNSDDPADKAASDDFKLKTAYLFNAIVLADPENKELFRSVVVLKSPTQIKKDIAAYDVNPEYGNVTDLEKGFNFTLERTGSGKTDTRYKAVASRHQTNIAETLATKGVNLNNLTMKKLDELLVAKSDAELLAALAGAGVQKAFAGASAPTPVAAPAAAPATVPFALPAPGGSFTPTAPAPGAATFVPTFQIVNPAQQGGLTVESNAPTAPVLPPPPPVA